MTDNQLTKGIRNIMGRPRKIQDLTETHGKDYTAEAKAEADKDAAPEASPIKRKATTLAELFPESETHRYKEKDVDTYRESLASMNKVELQHECTRVGKIPKDSRDRMLDILTKDFTDYQNAKAKIIRQPKHLVPNAATKKLLRNGQFA